MFGYRGRPSQLSKSDQRRPVQLIECRNPMLERLLALPHARTPASSTPALLWRSAFSTVSTICGALRPAARSEAHTSELQSLMRISYAVFCLKKKKKQTHQYI